MNSCSLATLVGGVRCVQLFVHFFQMILSPCTDCFDGLSLPNDSNLSHAPHFALLALLSTLEKYSHMGFDFDFCDISLSILGLVDDSTKLYDTLYTCMYANENCVTQLHNYSVVVQWLLDT